MPSSYTGSAGAISVVDPVTVSNPNDGELADATSNDTAIKTLANFTKFLLDAAGFLGVARSWTAIQTFTLGLLLRAANDASPLLDCDQNAGSGDYKLLFRVGAGGSRKLRFYLSDTQAFCITLNASWDTAANQWARDTATASYRLFLSAAGQYELQSKSGSATWLDNAWTWSTSFVASALKTDTVQPLSTTDIALDASGTVSVTNTLSVGGIVAAASAIIAGGVAAASATITNRVQAADVKLTSNPASTAAPGANVMPASLAPKAWVSLTITGGNGAAFAISVQDGANIASVTRQSATVFRITFAQAMANATYAAPGNAHGNFSTGYELILTARNASYVEFSISVGAAPSEDLDTASNANVWTCFVTVSGRQ